MSSYNRVTNAGFDIPRGTALRLQDGIKGVTISEAVGEAVDNPSSLPAALQARLSQGAPINQSVRVTTTVPLATRDQIAVLSATTGLSKNQVVALALENLFALRPPAPSSDV